MNNEGMHMTKDDIIRMAQEIGLPPVIYAHPGVKQLLSGVVQAEREACAKKWIETHGFDKHGVAEFIRSRGST